jgi:hypothetical protein
MRTAIITAALIISKPLRILADINQFSETDIMILLSITLTFDMFDYFRNNRKK